MTSKDWFKSVDDELLDKIRSGKHFYRDNFRRLLLACVVMMVVNFALIAIVFYHLTFPGSTDYYGTRTDSKLIPLSPTTRTE